MSKLEEVHPDFDRMGFFFFLPFWPLGCVGSSLLHVAFCSCSTWGPLLVVSGGFSCCRAWALGMQA